MLENVCTEIIACLRDAGMDARYMYSGGDVRGIKAPAVFVGVSGAKVERTALGDYLGTKIYDDLTAVELYGLMCEVTLAVDICMSAHEENCAAICVRTFDEVIAALSALEDLHIQSLSMGEGETNAKSGLYKCHCTARGSAYIIADGEDGIEFTDFVLKGVLKNER